jgi:hypothetical protein
MRTSRSQRGTTLLEAMVALVVMLVGTMGVMALHKVGVRLHSDARRITRASAIAQDLVDQINLWPYTDPRLSDANGGNNANLGDATYLFEQSGAPPADHGDADLTLGGTVWFGIPTNAIDATALGGARFERYWNVGPCRDATGAVIDLEANGVRDALCIAVIVRWMVAPGDPNAGWRRVVALTSKANPNP